MAGNTTTGFEGPDEEIEFDLESEGGDEREFEVEAPADEDAVADEDAEPAAEVEAAEPEAQPEAPKPKFRANQRISELARQNAEKEQRLAELERQLRERDELLAAERTAQFKAVETGLNSELAAARRKLADAHTLGDGEAIAAATEEVARLASDLSTVRAYNTAPQRVAPQQEQRQQQVQPAQIDPRTKAWVDSNPWFVPSNPDYDPELAVEAQAFAKKLEIRAQREGNAAFIGSDEYFNQINEHMARTYPDLFELEEAPAQKKVPPMASRQTVAPVQRQAAAMQQPKKSGVVKLTREQREFAEMMAPNLPPQQAWAQYARHMKG